jgi:dolichyl-phosphate-mannose--protein O-mannosyl transferase
MGISSAKADKPAPTNQNISNICVMFTTKGSFIYPLKSSSKPVIEFRVLLHVLHFWYSVKSKSLYFLKEYASLWVHKVCFIFSIMLQAQFISAAGEI